VKSAEILRRAIDVIHERGWHRGAMMDNNTGAVCAYGALHAAMEDQPDMCRSDIVKAIADEVVEMLGVDTKWDDELNPKGLIPIAWWNDYVCKDADEVVHAFKLTAELVESREKL
jgi:hypothetical protein